MLLDTYSRLNLLQLYCIPQGAGMRWFVAVRAMCFICGNSAAFLFFRMILYCRVQSPAVSKPHYVPWCGLGWSLPLSIDYVWESYIDRIISTPSCSYCIWNWYCQNHHRILPNSLLFAWFDTVEFNRLPCSNNKMYDVIVFDDRFRYQLTIFEVVYLYGYLDS